MVNPSQPPPALLDRRLVRNGGRRESQHKQCIGPTGYAPRQNRHGKVCGQTTQFLILFRQLVPGLLDHLLGLPVGLGQNRQLGLAIGHRKRQSQRLSQQSVVIGLADGRFRQAHLKSGLAAQNPTGGRSALQAHLLPVL